MENQEAIKKGFTHLPVKESVNLNAVFRAAGLSVDIIFTTVIFEICKKYLEKGADISIKEINFMIDELLQDPEYQAIQRQNIEAQQAQQATKNAPGMEVVK